VSKKGCYNCKHGIPKTSKCYSFGWDKCQLKYWEQSDQAERDKVDTTKCVICLEYKSTPFRRDEMGGYVCLTCVDKQLDKQDERIRKLEAEKSRNDLVMEQWFADHTMLIDNANKNIESQAATIKAMRACIKWICTLISLHYRHREGTGKNAESWKDLSREAQGQGKGARESISKTSPYGARSLQRTGETGINECRSAWSDSETNHLRRLRMEWDTTRSPQGLQQATGGGVVVLYLSREEAQAIQDLIARSILDQHQ